MKYHQLSSSALLASEIGFGCMSLGADERTNTDLIHAALDAGINYFDTADLYQNGQNEVLLGAALTEHRSKAIIATKVGNQLNPDKKTWSWNPSAAYIISAVEESLKRLKTDYIDLYQLHGGTIEDPIDETIGAFDKLVEQGKIRYYGISSIRPNVTREYIQRSNIVSVMLQYSLLDRRPEETVLPLLREKNIAALVRGSLAKGLLVDKTADHYLDYTQDQVHHAASAVQAISGACRKTSHTALRYALQQEGISMAVVGIRTMEQLQDIAAALQTPELTESEIQYLRASIPVNYYEQHR